MPGVCRCERIRARVKQPGMLVRAARWPGLGPVTETAAERGLDRVGHTDANSNI